MGCISTKHKNIQKNIPYPTNLQISKRMSGTSSCSTAATFSTKSFNHKFHRRSFQPSNILVVCQQQVSSTLKRSLLEFNPQKGDIVIGPYINSNVFDNQLKLQKKETQQIMNSYAHENIVLFMNNTSENIKNNDNRVLKVFLKDSIDIFVKIKVQCQQCLGFTLLTTPKTEFMINQSNCNCNGNMLNIRIVQIEPKLADLWLISQEKMMKADRDLQMTINKSDSFKLIGCSNCNSYCKLFKKQCGCGNCENCLPQHCQICFNQKISY